MPTKRPLTTSSPQNRKTNNTKKAKIPVNSEDNSSDDDDYFSIPSDLDDDDESDSSDSSVDSNPNSSSIDGTFPGTTYLIKDVIALCKRIKENLPQDDSLKFSTQRKKLNWSKIASDAFDASTASAMWDNLQNSLRTYKTMTDLINEVIAKTDVSRKPLTAYFEYYTRNKDAYLATHPGINAVQLTKGLSEEYAKLSEEERQKYKSLAEKNLSLYKEKCSLLPPSQTGAPPKKPRTPSYYFLIVCLKKQLISKDADKRERWNQVRDLYKRLPDEKKLKYIEKAYQGMEKYEKELDEYRLIHPDYKGVVYTKLLSKKDLTILNRAKGRPVKPPVSGYAIFTRKVLPVLKEVATTDRMKRVSALWKGLADIVKAGYEFESQVSISEYLTTFDEYVSKLPSDARQKIVRSERIKYPSGHKLETLRVAIDANTKAKSMKYSELINEPGLLNGAIIFYSHEKFLETLESNNSLEQSDDQLREAREEWPSLPKNDKKRYLKKAYTCREIQNETESKACGRMKKFLPEKTITTSKKADLDLLNDILNRKPKEKQMTGYMIFFSRNSSNVEVDTANNYRNRGKMKVIGQMWKELPDRERQKYEMEAKISKERVRDEHRQFEDSLNNDEMILYQHYMKMKTMSKSKLNKKNNDSVSASEESENEKQDEDSAASQTETDDDDDEIRF